MAALIGAAGGLVGGAGAALSAIRSSQLAARVPLATKIHELNRAIARLPPAINTPAFKARLIEFNFAWNDFIVHQKILAPSYRIGVLADLIFHATLDPTLPPKSLAKITGDTMNAATEMISAQSRHLFRWRARIAEWRIARRFAKKVRPDLTPTLLPFLRET